MNAATIQWQVAEDGAREVHAIPRDACRTQWVVSPVSGGLPAIVSAADLAPTEDVALLLWHERAGRTTDAAEIVARIGVHYRGLREAGADGAREIAADVERIRGQVRTAILGGEATVDAARDRLDRIEEDAESPEDYRTVSTRVQARTVAALADW